MKTLSITLLTDQQNNAVVQLPDRKFPGLVLQGDTLAALVMQADIVRRLAQEHPGELKEEVEYLHASLQALQARYEEALAMYGIELPYPSARPSP